MQDARQIHVLQVSRGSQAHVCRESHPLAAAHHTLQSPADVQYSSSRLSMWLKQHRRQLCTGA